jgi:hypothetical protein
MRTLGYFKENGIAQVAELGLVLSPWRISRSFRRLNNVPYTEFRIKRGQRRETMKNWAKKWETGKKMEKVRKDYENGKPPTPALE